MIPKNIEQKLKHNIACCVRKDIIKYGVRGTLTYAEFLEKLNNQKNKCYVCKQDFRYDGDAPNIITLKDNGSPSTWRLPQSNENA